MNTKLSLFVFVIAFFAILSSAAMTKAAVDAPQILTDLNFGTRNEDVRNLQRFLNASGFTVTQSGPGSFGNETALFGSATRAALVRYQSANGIPATGGFDNKTRILFAIHNLKNQINSLLEQLNAIAAGASNSSNSDTAGPHIISLRTANTGGNGYIDSGDSITIAFNEAIDPKSINNGLVAGNRVSEIANYENGGVSVTADGIVTIKGIAQFDMGSVKNAGTFVVNVALSSDAKTLTVTLSSGSGIEITNEDLGRVAQTGGTVRDKNGNKMQSNAAAVAATGTFGAANQNSSTTNPEITAINVYDGGNCGYIDKSDYIDIAFNKAIDPKSINENLASGVIVANLYQSDIGGLRVTADGRVDINGIAAFDMGAVKNAGAFTSKASLDSSGRVLTITIDSGTAVEITDEDFGQAAQIGGIVKDTNGNVMQGKSDVVIPIGTFGGVGANGPNIVSIKAFDGNSEGYIDQNDYINIAFDRAIDPASVNFGLVAGGTVTGIGYSQTGGVAISPYGEVIVRNIATFKMGSVQNSGNYSTNVSLSSDGTILVVELSAGNGIEITQENLGQINQVGDTISDEDGGVMTGKYNIGQAAGTFGGEL